MSKPFVLSALLILLALPQETHAQSPPQEKQSPSDKVAEESPQRGRKPKRNRRKRSRSPRQSAIAPIGLSATLWTQSSIEFEANARSVYRNATHSLSAAIDDPRWSAVPTQASQLAACEDPERPEGVLLQPAVIMDVDETVLSNSRYQAWLNKHNLEFDIKTWNAWVSESQATPLPGVCEFVEACRERGVRVFYVTNRDALGDVDDNRDGKISASEADRDLKPYTIKNLVDHGLLPQEGLTNEQSVVLRGQRQTWASSDKTPRRAHLCRQYRILLLVGDTIGDFTSTASGDVYKTLESANERDAVMRQHRHRWGKSWFMLPNPQYGYWQRAPFDFDFSRPREQRIRNQIEALDVWQGSPF